MIRDWLVTGIGMNPYRFAQANYAQYPAFSVPYHPPGYPGLLGLIFCLTGTSYVASRAFVATCLGAAACGTYAIQRHFGLGRAAAFATALLLITMPEIARWGRDTMSEIPALAFILGASYLFVRWLDSGRPRDCWGAFGAATMAFLCRVTTVGNLPGWFLFAFWTGRWRRLKSPHLIAATAIFMIVAIVQVKISAQFGRYEVAADGKSERLSWANLAYFPACLPEILTWGTSLAGLAGLAYALGFSRRTRVARFWTAWLVSYGCFKLAMPTTPETRHFLGAMPAFAGLAACLLTEGSSAPFARRVGPVIVALGLMLNLPYLASLPRGVVGYEEVAAGLADQIEPGNVLLSCPQDQELIFRYRAHASGTSRMLIRGDRTLAVRLSEYARVDAVVKAHSPEDVVQVVRKGRIRYIVTAEPLDPSRDDRPPEMALAHRTASSMPEAFAPVFQSPLLVQFGGQGNNYQVHVWAYRGQLPDGPSELEVAIPTANLVLAPAT